MRTSAVELFLWRQRCNVLAVPVDVGLILPVQSAGSPLQIHLTVRSILSPSGSRIALRLAFTSPKCISEVSDLERSPLKAAARSLVTRAFNTFSYYLDIRVPKELDRLEGKPLSTNEQKNT